MVRTAVFLVLNEIIVQEEFLSLKKVVATIGLVVCLVVPSVVCWDTWQVMLWRNRVVWMMIL